MTYTAQQLDSVVDGGVTLEVFNEERDRLKAIIFKQNKLISEYQAQQRYYLDSAKRAELRANRAERKALASTYVCFVLGIVAHIAWGLL